MNVNFERTSSGTYATEYYDIPGENKDYVVCSKLSGSSWKRLKSWTVNNGNGGYLSIDLYGKTPSAIYNTGKTTYGYNLKAGTYYKLPFSYKQNMIAGGSAMSYRYGSRIYQTKDTYRNITKISLKSGSSTITRTITGVGRGTIGKTNYLYIICGSRMYYTTYSKLVAIR